MAPPITRESISKPRPVLKPSQQPLRGVEFETGHEEPPGPVPLNKKGRMLEKKRRRQAGEIDNEPDSEEEAEVKKKQKRLAEPEWKRKEIVHRKDQMKQRRRSVGGGLKSEKKSVKKVDRASSRADEGMRIGAERHVENYGARTPPHHINDRKGDLEASAPPEGSQVEESLFIEEDAESDEEHADVDDSQGAQPGPATPSVVPAALSHIATATTHSSERSLSRDSLIATATTHSSERSLSKDSLEMAAEVLQNMTAQIPTRPCERSQMEALNKLISTVVCSTNFDALIDHGEKWLNRVQKKLEAAKSKIRISIAVLHSSVLVLIALAKFFRATIQDAGAAGVHFLEERRDGLLASFGPVMAIMHLKQHVSDTNDLADLRTKVVDALSKKRDAVGRMPSTVTTDRILAETALESLRYLLALVKDRQKFMANKKHVATPELAKEQTKGNFRKKLSEMTDLDAAITASKHGIAHLEDQIGKVTSDQVPAMKVIRMVSAAILKISQAAKAAKTQRTLPLEAENAIQILEDSVADVVDLVYLRKLLSKALDQLDKKLADEEKDTTQANQHQLEALLAGLAFAQTVADERYKTKLANDRAEMQQFVTDLVKVGDADGGDQTCQEFFSSLK